MSDEEQLLSSSGEIRANDPYCSAAKTEPNPAEMLNATEFTLVSWNIYKENKEGWKKDLLTLSNASDLILLQEAYLTQTLNQFLVTSGQKWDMISAFRYRGIHAGVMTIGDIPAQTSCAQRATEPIAFLPKSSLINYYPIRNTQHTLLVANIHAINFTLGIKEFSEQLLHIKTVLANHQGPIVFGGDFNTWSDQRELALDQLIGNEELGLHKVDFVSNEAPLVWGHRLDHIFFRGLKVIKAEIIPVESSDHYPLKVQFEFVPENE
ncbi:hypothetical protein AU255_00095 [Methyloprofundus sedimenti]|uniref:Endonuclease/exonuclease/phosphatase domain-containing protein n=1 Tax=Methyloprofundus sedimenti TaxID=1420851 RepID=A0A1V8M4M9_9GAMM|nr:hypothetical protein AU255_00095 [Methyloprofundus sedimenti]